MASATGGYLRASPPGLRRRADSGSASRAGKGRASRSIEAVGRGRRLGRRAEARRYVDVAAMVRDAELELRATLFG